MDLEAQLDSLLEKLEEVDPDTVPADLRKNPPVEAVVPEAEAVEAEVEVQEAESEASSQSGAEPVVVAIGENAESGAEASEKSSQPGGAGLDADAIASMASELLSAQIDDTIDSAAVQVGAEGAANEAGSEPVAVEPSGEGAAGAETEDEEDKPKAVVSLSEDDLASQLQDLLSGVQGGGGGTSGAGAESAEAATPTEVVAEAQATPGEPAATEESGAVSIDQIDAMLADSAEQAVEHGPDPEADVPPGTDEVLAAQAKAEEDAEARAKADRDAAEPVPVAVEASETVSEPEPVAVSVTEAEAEPVAVEPEPVPAATGASAEDVANELDEGAEPVVVPADEVAVGEGGGGSGGEVVVIKRSGLRKAEHALMKVCGKVNRPLNGLSEEMRNTVGYAGVVTTLLALFMVLYGVLF
jgi:hypothetical protein